MDLSDRKNIDTMVVWVRDGRLELGEIPSGCRTIVAKRLKALNEPERPEEPEVEKPKKRRAKPKKASAK